MKLWFVEYLTEDPHIPTQSWHVTGTTEEADALRRYLQASDVTDPIVLEVEGSKTISELYTELYNDWGVTGKDDDEEEDEEDDTDG